MKGHAVKLQGRLESKPWGHVCVPQANSEPEQQIGDRRSERRATFGHPVVIKCLYTSERLSIQVHPDDRQARQSGHASGKDELWIVLDAKPDSTIGIGLNRQSDASEVKRAVADGSIVDMIDWRPVQRGDVIYNRAGTIHAAGAGLVLLEVQPAMDVTYRLFDYGRPRELHLDEALAASRFERHFDERDCRLVDGESRLLSQGPYFGAAWCAGMLPAGVPRHARNLHLVVISGTAFVNGQPVSAGEAAFPRTIGELHLKPSATVLLTWPAAEVLTKAA